LNKYVKISITVCMGEGSNGVWEKANLYGWLFVYFKRVSWYTYQGQSAGISGEAV